MSFLEKWMSLVSLGVLLFIMMGGSAGANPVARTESICNLGMVKGESSKSCHVPIPADCSVANFSRI